MNIQVLIDSTVRQVTVLIAQLATSGGMRTPLARVANQVFVELARELEAQGVSRKVSADMFGMALRAYIRKVHRLSEGETFTGKTLWQAVLEFVQAEGMVAKTRLHERFRHDGEREVSSIIRDLIDSGLVFSSASGEATVLRAATDEELGRFSALLGGERLDELVWVLVYRHGPLTISALAERLSQPIAEVEKVVQRLVDLDRLQRTKESISAREFVVPLGTSEGWEAAVFDHIRAVVQTICQRLQESSRGGDPGGVVGGSTYTFDVWPEHPLYHEVRSHLAESRARLGKLRERVEEFNRDNSVPEDFEEVVAYVGQCVFERQSKGQG